MEAATSAIASTLRVGLNVIINQRRPILEFYSELRNEIDPADDHLSVTQPAYRHSDIYLAFSLFNIGGIRAENVLLTAAGDFRRTMPPTGWGPRFGLEHAQMAPGQFIFLFRIDAMDLLKYPEGGGKAIGNREEKLELIAEYDGPNAGLNVLFRLLSRMRSKKQYTTRFVFDPRNAMGDLPLARYA